MNSVDIANQLQAYYETHFKFWRTWYPIFFWAIDIMISNSFIIYRDHLKEDKGLEHKEVRIQLAWEFIIGWSGGTTAPSKKHGLMISLPISVLKQPCYITKNSKLAPSKHVGDHVPTHIEGRHDCAYCKWNDRRNENKVGAGRTRTHWKCITCDLPLCLSVEQNCFIDFHS